LDTVLALETATHISDLVASNPAASDGMNNADDHMRMIKGVLKTDFPSISGPVTASHTQLNNITSWLTSGATLLYSGSAGFSANPTDSFQNPAAGEIDIVLQGTLASQFYKSGATLNFHHRGPALFDGAITGPGVTPIGGMIMWLTDALPVGNGSWCWANGGTLPRTGAGAALFALWGTTYGPGDGSTTFNVINMQEVTPVGRSQMGGGTPPGLLNSISAGVKAVLNGLFGSDTHTLTASEIPTITATQNAAVGIAVDQTDYSITSSDNSLNSSATTGGGYAAMFIANGAAPRHAHSTGTIANGTITTSSSNTGGAAHAITQPSRAVNFIIRYA
jgi:microcystin-dependent protein